MNDSRVKEALELAFEREKLIKRLEALPQIPEVMWTDNIVICMQNLPIFIM